MPTTCRAAKTSQQRWKGVIVVNQQSIFYIFIQSHAHYYQGRKMTDGKAADDAGESRTSNHFLPTLLTPLKSGPSPCHHRAHWQTN